jgi:DnaJ homolog subfamily C member 7
VLGSEAFQVDKKSPDVLCVRGLVMFLEGKLPAALQHVQQALAYDPDHTRARKLMRRIKDVERMKEEGNVAFKAGWLGEAVDKYTAALGVVEGREDEARGGPIRATLLSNRATALLKVRGSGDSWG